jgi:hypothetical protein
MLLVWIAAFFIMWFRWKLFSPLLGTVRMYLFDALMWTCWSAYEFTQVSGPLGALAVIFGLFFAYSAISSGRTYLKLDEAQRIENGKGKPNSGAAKGS